MKILKIFLLIFFATNIGFAQKQYTGQSIEDILKLPEKDISISIVTLVLAKEFYPNMNVPFFLEAFDYLADRFNYYFGKYTDPNDIIAALNTYLYKPGYWNDNITFCYDDDDLQVTKLDNKFINGYISSKKGSCITMPMLYIILGEKLNIPLKPVRSAKHFFVRYEPEGIKLNFQLNIEATNGGGFISDDEYQESVLIPDKAIKNGVYLRTLTKKEYIASLLLTNANEYIHNKNIEKAKHYYKLAMKYDVPVIFHSGDPAFSSAPVKYCHPIHLDDTACRFPDLKIVISHLGFPWFTDTMEVVLKNPNVYTDISGLFSGEKSAYKEKMKDELRHQIENIFYFGAEKKVFFGTDYSLVSYDEYVRFAEKIKISKTDLNRLFYENAKNLYKF